MIQEIIYASLIGLVFSAMFVLVEYIKRKYSISAELTRRVTHLVAGCYAIVGYYCLDRLLFYVLFATFLIVVLYSQKHKLLTSVHNVRRTTYGEIFFPIAVILTSLIVGGHRDIFLTSIMITAISDPFAGIVCDFQKKPHKTLLGYFVFIISALVIMLITLPNQLWTVSLLVSVVLATVEWFSKYGSDNITVPIVSAVLLLALQA
jgi:phytol kinase